MFDFFPTERLPIDVRRFLWEHCRYRRYSRSTRWWYWQEFLVCDGLALVPSNSVICTLLSHFCAIDRNDYPRASEQQRRVSSSNERCELTESDSVLMIEFRSPLVCDRVLFCRCCCDKDGAGGSVDSCLQWCRWTRSPMTRRNECRETGIVVFDLQANESVPID